MNPLRFTGTLLSLLIIWGFAVQLQAQELVPLPFEESTFADQQELQSLQGYTGQKLYLTNTLNSNPLLDGYDVKFYGLDVKMDNRSDEIHGNTTILVEVKRNSFDTLIFELNHTLLIESVLVEGEVVKFTHTGDELYITLSLPRDSGTMITAQVFYGGETGEGMVLETDDDWGFPVTFTHSEPFYSKDWFPCKENLEDKADSVHVFITTPYGLMGVSNGILTGTTYFPNGQVRHEWKSNYPIAFYLISIAVADYMEYNIEAGPDGLAEPILIQNFLYDGQEILNTYMDQINVTIPIMELFCDLFGPYPFREEKYGHYLWPWGGGMEHQTMTGMGNFEFYLVAHELGHSWFGDYVTCATWQDIWINEGFATYAGYLATENLEPQYADGEREYRFERAMLDRDGSVFVPAEDADNDSRIFSGNLSYNKGMALIHMIRFELQDDKVFFLSLRNFIDRYANHVATGMDFKEVLEETSGMDFTDFFDQWYFGAGFPIYELTWEQLDQELTLHSLQTTSSEMTPLFKMSVEYKIFFPGGDTTVRVFHGTNEESYLFQIPYTVDSIQVDPDNWVLNELVGDVEKTTKKGADVMFSIAPNPNPGLFSFRLLDQNGGDVTVEVYNGSGQLVHRERFEGCLPYAEYTLDMKGRGMGLHYIRFGYGDQFEILKMIAE